MAPFSLRVNNLSSYLSKK